MLWALDEREKRIKEIKEYLDFDPSQVKSVEGLPKTEESDKIVKEVWEENKKRLLDSIVTDEDGNWIGTIDVHFTPDPIALLPQLSDTENNKMEDNEQMDISQKYKWFNKMKDSKDTANSDNKKGKKIKRQKKIIVKCHKRN